MKYASVSFAMIARAAQNQGQTKKAKAWIPTLPKEQPDTKAREARSQPG